MGCFFGCFRVRDNRRTPVHLLSQPISSNPKDPVESVARIRLSSLLLVEAEDRDQSPRKDRKCSVLGSAAADINLNELKAEAKFLNDCGTLPQTPAEIRNNDQLKDLEPNNGNTESSRFHSWLQNASIEKLKLDKQTDQQPSPVKLVDERENGSDTLSQSPDSCLTGQNSERHFSSSHDVKIIDKHAELAQNPTNSFSLSSASSEITCQEPKPSESPNDYSVSKPSPYPTPLTLTNDMQTPGTVFPSYLHNPRIRSRYVYSVLNPVENADQFKKMIKESFNSDDNYSAQFEEDIDTSAVPAGEMRNVDTSLSSWLPPKQLNNNRSFVGKSKTPGDRPILGMVAAHWKADETVVSPPKWWDGNGIPNSTNKYKEDQKVSWHATPFEERLEKALSEDKLIAERKQLGKTPLEPINLDEKEELDASSHFESGFILINSS